MDKIQDWTEILNRTGVVVPPCRFKAVTPVEKVHKTIWLECLKLDVIALSRRVLPVPQGCFVCGLIGHYARECPYIYRREQQNSPRKLAFRRREEPMEVNASGVRDNQGATEMRW